MSGMISTTVLAKKLCISTKEMFAILSGYAWIEKSEDSWSLTDLGKEIGGEYATHQKYGTYIAWPEDIARQLGDEDESVAVVGAVKLLSATAVGEKLKLSAQRINRIFSELGWIEKGLKGWKITSLGSKLGGIQKDHPKTGIPYVNWPESIITNANFSALVRELEEGSADNQVSASDTAEGKAVTASMRDKFEAKLRTTDGHYVRSKAEMLIDNWLYMAELVHAYERKLPVEEELYSDFYIPAGKVYIEYWGYENDPKYLARKEKKREIYAKYGFKLIELEDKDIQNLDDILPRLLLKHGVESY